MAELNHDTIITRIIDILKADSQLAKPSIVKEYYSHVPVQSPSLRNPYCYVILAEERDRRLGPGTPGVGAFEVEYSIAFFEKNVKPWDAEKKVRDLSERAKVVLKSNQKLGEPASPTVDTKVLESWPIRRRPTILLQEQDYSIAGMVVTLQARATG